MNATAAPAPAAEDVRGLRFITYLAPSIPRALFEGVVDHFRRRLGHKGASLRVSTRVSGPERGTADSFSGGEADVGFVCSPSYLWLREREPSPVELLGVAPVFGSGRNGDRPAYFCDVISARGNDISGFADLRGRSWAYNDACSLSGYYGLLRKLDEMGEDPRFFGEVLHSGSHLDSIRMVADHEADAATIDSNVLWMRLKERPALADLVRVIDSWGPFPVQPVVVRSGLDPALKGALRDAFLDLDVYAVAALAEFGFRRFAPVTDEDYAPERLLPNASEKPAPL
jgi:ABC-type phosphate/phosphonate transport system substrate-binding protein